MSNIKRLLLSASIIWASILSLAPSNIPLNGDDTWTCPTTAKVFFTGGQSTPRHRLQAAKSFQPSAQQLATVPTKIAYVPKFRSMFGNDQYGDCVSAEEAFTKTAVNPELFNSQASVDQLEQITIAWARSHGVLHGAALDEVLDWMKQKGFQVNSQLYNDGDKSGVDYGNESILQAAIAQGPVKIAIAAGALPGGAGSKDGWYKLGTNNNRTDHSVTICGYGPADWCYSQLNVPLPSGLTATTNGYLVYTWSTIGFVDHAWVMGTVDEAWLRTPTTVGVPPLAPPTPPGPGPFPPPGPGPGFPIQVIIDTNTPPGTYILLPKVTP